MAYITITYVILRCAAYYSEKMSAVNFVRELNGFILHYVLSFDVDHAVFMAYLCGLVTSSLKGSGTEPEQHRNYLCCC